MAKDYPPVISDAISEVVSQLDNDIKFYCVGDDKNSSSDAENLLPLMQQSATTQPPEPKERDFYGNCLSVKIFSYPWECLFCYIGLL